VSCAKRLPLYSPNLSVPLPIPTADSLFLNQWASYALEQMYRPEYEYKKAGVILSDIRPDHIVQEDLFSAVDVRPRAELMKTLDQINARYGRGTLKVSSDGSRRKWEMRAEKKSPSYTTDWDQIAQCR
jgi:DNA polymerase V